MLAGFAEGPLDSLRRSFASKTDSLLRTAQAEVKANGLTSVWGVGRGGETNSRLYLAWFLPYFGLGMQVCSELLIAGAPLVSAARACFVFRLTPP
jgi:hypothetical protein